MIPSLAEEKLVTNKENFANQFADEFRPGYAGSKQDIARYDFVSKYMAGCFVEDNSVTRTNLYSESFNDQLEDMGFHIYALEEQPIIVPRSSGADILMNNVIIMHDSYNNQWLVSGGGYWKTQNWLQDSALGGYWGPNVVGGTQNIGGLDGVGVILYK